jgi:ATP-dependent helicase HepA
MARQIMFCYVKTAERDGLAKLVGKEGNRAIVEYFNSPSKDGRIQREVLAKLVTPKRLGRNTRVHTYDEACNEWRIGRVREDDGEGVEIRLADKQDVYLPYEQVFVRWKWPIQDPVAFLGHFVTETPMYAQSRSGFLESYLTQRGSAFGISALLSSSIELEPHQVGVVRRVLTDPSQRYLLADEVGLGKTIEAGVIIRQAVLDDLRGHRVLVLVPPTLVSQWQEELATRFGLRDFIDESVFVLPHEDTPELRDVLSGLSIIVIDEAHQLADPNAGAAMQRLFHLVSKVAQNTDRLLLLSATPILRNEAGFLRMLHLLDPVVYPLDDLENFHAKIVNRQALAETVAVLDPSNSFFMDAALDDLQVRIPNDERLAQLTLALKERLIELPEEDDPDFCDAIRGLRAHITETYRLNRRILRNRRRQVSGLTPDRKGSQVWVVKDSSMAFLESAMEDWRIAASASMEPNGSALNRSLEDFYWRVFRALLEEPQSLPMLCADRLRNMENGTCTSIPGEAALLGVLQRSFDVQQWMETRVDRLADGLRSLPPAAKAVVFCATESRADAVFANLKGRHFAVVRHNVDDERGPGTRGGWSEFLDNPAIKVLVCGSGAEEGMNLQGGSKVVVHFDLPVEPNRIEQRMGRVDRYGAGDPVRSYVLVDQGAPLQTAWFNVLDQGLGVFHRSISSLQYLAEAEIADLRMALAHGGIEALVSLQKRLDGANGLAARELKLIDQQDALDELSPVVESDLDNLFEADGDWKNIRGSMLAWIEEALLFRKVYEPQPPNTKALDDPFRLHYCSPDGDTNQPTLIPSASFIDDFLGAIDFEAPGSRSTRPQSYPFAVHRPTAVKRGVRPLRYGAEFVEAIKNFSDLDDRGRSFAMWRQVFDRFPAAEIKMCFRFDFLIETRLEEAVGVLTAQQSSSTEAARSVLARRGDALFCPVLVHAWVDEDGNELPHDFINQFLLPSYAKTGGDGYIDKNLETPHLRSFRRKAPDIFANWSERCVRVRDQAQAIVLKRDELMQRQRQALKQARAEDEIRHAQLQTRIRSLQGAEAVAESSQLILEKALSEALCSGISSPSVKVDVAGVVFLTSEPVSIIEPAIQEQA